MLSITSGESLMRGYCTPISDSSYSSPLWFSLVALFIFAFQNELAINGVQYLPTSSMGPLLLPISWCFTLRLLVAPSWGSSADFILRKTALLSAIVQCFHDLLRFLWIQKGRRGIISGRWRSKDLQSVLCSAGGRRASIMFSKSIMCRRCLPRSHGLIGRIIPSWIGL